jgi:adrenodoxin-NADP+ reductase
MEDEAATAETRKKIADEAREALWESVAKAGTDIVTYKHWQNIDSAERERGRALGKKREKFLTRRELLQASRGDAV